MIYVNILEDEELQKVIKTFISALLPHKNFKKENFAEVLQAITSYIKLEEFSMEYFVLLSAITELNRINLSVNNVPYLTKDIFSDIVEISVEDLINNNSVRIKEYLEHEGVNSNLSVQTNKEAAMQRLYSRSMDLYTECFDMAVPTNEAISYLPAYKSAFLARVMLDSANIQSTIIIKGCWIGKTFYSGYQECLEYLTHFTNVINERLNDVENDSSLYVVDSLEKIEEMDKALKDAFTPIAYWGIPELDGNDIIPGTPILRYSMTVIVGSVNMGKSMFCKDASIQVVMQNYRVVYMYGEGSREEVWAGLLINYIYKKFQKFVTTQMLIEEESQPEEIQKIIRLAKVELYESGAVSLREAYDYDLVYEQVMDDYKKHNFDLLIIDHSLALKSNGKTSSENVHNMSIALRNVKRKIPIAIIVASHPSAAAKEYMGREGKIPSEVSTTRESSTLEAEADFLYILRSNAILEKQGLIALEDKKRRRAAHLQEQVILTKMFDVCHFEYDPARQATEELDRIDAESALLEMEQAYKDDDLEDAYSLD